MEHDIRLVRLLGRWSQPIIVTFIALAATLPFLGKAFHIDDPLYLAVARQILVDPWDPFGAEILWEKSPELLFDADFNPPLWSYLLASVLAFSGEPEVSIATRTDDLGMTIYRAEASSRLPELLTHGLEGIFMCAAVVATYQLSRRWVRWPTTATALIVFSPAILPGQNIMLEGPVMAFWLWCVWCYLRGVDTNSLVWIWLSSLLAALAVMTKYTSGLLILLLAIDSVRRRYWKGLLIPALPLIALFLWSVHNWFVYERLHLLVIFSRAQTSGREVLGVRFYETWGRLFAVFRAVGAGTALAIPVLVTVARRLGIWTLLLLATMALGVAWLGEMDMGARLVERDGRLPGKVFPATISAHVLAFGTLGTFTLVGLGLSFWSEQRGGARAEPLGSEEFFLITWVLAVFAFAVLATPFLAMRHLIPLLSPLTWLTLRRFAMAFEGSGRTAEMAILGLAVAVSSSGGFLVAKADYDWAQWYRHLALDVASRTVEAGRGRNKTVWYTGHWGWAYYAERVGMKPYLPGHTTMRDGDFLLMPLVQTWQLPPQELYPHLKGMMPPIRPIPRPQSLTGLDWVDRALHWSFSGVRSIANEVHFYGCGTVSVPWQFSRRPLDFFDVIEVRLEDSS